MERGMRTRGERGATSTEYGLLIASIAFAVVFLSFLWGTMHDGMCYKLADANELDRAVYCEKP